MKEKARSAPKAWMAGNDEDVVKRLVDEFDISVPVLHEDRMELTEEEVDIDVSRDPNRPFVDRSRPFYIKGLRITVHVPFTGDGGLFEVQPASFTLNPPRGDVKSKELHLVYEVSEERAAALKSTIDEQIRSIKSYLLNLGTSVDQFRTELALLASAEWKARKESFSSRETVLSSLNIPRRKAIEIIPRQAIPVPQVLNARKPKGGQPEWDLFISHASEDKQLVARPLAQVLSSHGLKIWFDESTLKLGDSLRQKIDEGLAKSKFGIVILSKSFFSKHWPQQELNGLVAREVQGRKVILPVWHELTQTEVAAFSPMLADKLAVSTAPGIEEVARQILEVIKS